MTEIIAVKGWRDLGRFLRVPWAVHGDDPQWVPPLLLERRLHCSRFNPVFEHARWQGFVALQGGRPVGRISAQVDDLHRRCHGPDSGHFGMLDAVDDPAVWAALFGAAEGWLADQGARSITGPFSFSINQECGVLVDGFDTPPVLMMPHGRPWYDARLREQGYTGVKDLLAYWVETDFTPPKVMQGLLRRYRSRVVVRPMRRDRLAAELAILRDLFNDAWSENWGFIPFTEAEFRELGQLLKFLVDDELVQIAELDGEPAAFIVGLPNINEPARAFDGALLPLNWWRLLRALRGGHIATGRVPLMGVRKEHQRSPLGSALAFMVIGAVKQELTARGIMHVEMSWILEDNQGMRSILDAIGSRLYKRYRMYEKTLAAA